MQDLGKSVIHWFFFFGGGGDFWLNCEGNVSLCSVELTISGADHLIPF